MQRRGTHKEWQMKSRFGAPRVSTTGTTSVKNPLKVTVGGLAVPTATLLNCCGKAGEPQAAMPASTSTPMAYNRSFVRKNISVTAASSAAVRAIKQRGARRRQNRPKTLDIGTLHRGCVLNQSDVSLLANGRAWRMDARRTQVSENRMYLVQGARNQICNVDYPFPRRKGSVALRLSGDAIASIAESITSILLWQEPPGYSVRPPKKHDQRAEGTMLKHLSQYNLQIILPRDLRSH